MLMLVLINPGNLCKSYESWLRYLPLPHPCPLLVRVSQNLQEIFTTKTQRLKEEQNQIIFS